MTRPTRLVLLGHPVAHSLSPRMHAAALHYAGIALRYDALDVAPDALPATLTTLCAERAAGNVTIPHKQTVAKRCDVLTDVARVVGAVNTFWVDDDSRLVGDNTDVAGFDTSARALFAEAGKPLPSRIAILGAGGAAAAVTYACSAWPGATVTIWSRDAARARALAQRFDGAHAEPMMHDALASADLVVNATPIGLADDTMPTTLDALPDGCAVFDLVYRARETAWVRAARERGHAARDGLGMLVEQAAVAFERWFGVTPDRRVMWESLD